MICSFCETKMQLSNREGIEINLCPQCGGAWLSRGALEGLLARSSGTAPDGRNRPDRQQSEDRDEDDDEGFSTRGGKRDQRGDREERGGGVRDFLGNLFDFG